MNYFLKNWHDSWNIPVNEKQAKKKNYPIIYFGKSFKYQAMKEKKTVIITGFNSGIGKQAAIKLAKNGYSIIGIARSKEKAQLAAKDIKSASGNNSIDYFIADLSIPSEIHDLAQSLKRNYKKIDVLINNAGIYLQKKQITPPGLEKTFVVNCLAPFLLSRLLVDLLIKAPDPRIVNVSSESHKSGRIDYMRIQGAGKYRGYNAYSNSKLALMMMTYELADRLKRFGINVTSVHPGMVPHTGGLTNAPFWLKPIIKLIAILPGIRTVEQGAEPIVYASSSPNITGITKAYMKDKKMLKPARAVENDLERNNLWQYLCSITGLTEEIVIPKEKKKKVKVL
ncbi:MAG: SDR family NAD(P)-dependent oxidoreductase [bacterium]